MSKVPAESDVEIEWWDNEALLDPLYLIEETKVNEAQRWHLEWLSGSLTDRSGLLLCVQQTPARVQGTPKASRKDEPQRPFSLT